MLNELCELDRSLSEMQVTTLSWHRHYKPCPQGSKTFFVLLDKNGQVTEIELLNNPEHLTVLRKFEVEAGVSFPSFNVLPLLEPRNVRVRNRIGELRKALGAKDIPRSDWHVTRLRRLVCLSHSIWTKKEPARINKCMIALPGELAKSLGMPPPAYSAVAHLLARSQMIVTASLHQQLLDLVVRRIEQAPSAAADWIDFLFFHRGKLPKKVSLVLEVAERSAFEFPASHIAVHNWINHRLQARDAATVGSSVTADAYGNSAENFEEAFPAVRMSILGNVILRAMSSESPCQHRYGAANGGSFPVGRKTRQHMKNALEWISAVDRKGKTWCDVSSIGGTRGVLLAYPSQRPELAPELAGMFAGAGEFGDPNGIRFEACATRVTETLKGQLSNTSTSEIRVFVLSKPDGFRTKVQHSGRYSVHRLLESARFWQRDAHNVPGIRIRQFGENKGDKPIWADALIPFPGEVVWCLNTVWQRMGNHAEHVGDFEMADGLALLLERGAILRKTAERAIRGLFRNALPLALAIAQANHQASVHPLGKKYSIQARLVFPIFGLLLAKLDRWKGAYMKGPPFLVGRLLSVADQLHVKYCQTVRKNEIPPQLIGNALMSTALEQPTKALALLCQRILPYQSWARTLQSGEQVRLTKWLLGELGRICAELKDLELPLRCDDSDKAEMLLGYLARAEKQDSGNELNPNTTQGENP